uniref:Uncharacterized protein n=1 Tax=Acrobeloides nanus TaxID=290746 RepID=A0A914DY55_9BILA
MLLLIQDQARTAIYAPSQGLKKTAIVQLNLTIAMLQPSSTTAIFQPKGVGSTESVYFGQVADTTTSVYFIPK